MNKKGLSGLSPMQGLTDTGCNDYMPPNDKPKAERLTTTGLPQRVKTRLQPLKIAPREPDYAVIDRLLDEHDIRTMREVVAKRIR